MAKTANLTLTFTIVGDGDSYAVTYTQPINTNAPPTSGAQLQAGNNTVLAPSNFTVQGVVFKPPSTSSNTKKLLGVATDTGIVSWTNQAIVATITANATVVVNSAGIETIECLWF